MPDFFEIGEWYIRKDHKVRSERHHLVEAKMIESDPPPTRYYVEIIGHWHPIDGFNVRDLRRFEMILFEFQSEVWRRVPDAEKNNVIMGLFSE